MLIIEMTGINTYFEAGMNIKNAPSNKNAITYPIIGPIVFILDVLSANFRKRYISVPSTMK